MEQARMNLEEIDLKELFLRLVLISKRNFWLIAAFFALGTALGTIYYALAPSEYTSEMVLNSDVLKEAYIEGAGDVLNDVIRDKNSAQLASMLGLTAEQTKNVSAIGFRNTYQLRDKQKDDYYLTVTTKVLDQSVLPALGNGIVNFLENNEYARARADQKKSFLTQMISKLDQEIASLENFKASFYSGSGSFLEKSKGGMFINPADINAEIIELNREKFNLQNDLSNVRAIEIVQPFVPTIHPSWPKKSISLSAGAFVGLMLVAILIAFKSVRKLIRLAEENEAKKIVS